MKNKRKLASLLTIATSLILCIISTFGITLAFFGGNASANLSTITLKTGIEIGAAIESSVGSAKVVPGQPVKITATGTVSATTQGTNPDANNAVDGVVRAKFNVGNELGEVTIAGNTTDHWTSGNDGYYYLVTAENGTTLRTVSKGTSVQIFGDLIVSKNFTNADSGKSVEASVIFEVIQAGVYDSVSGELVDMTVANATNASSPLYASFSAIKGEEYVAPAGLIYLDESAICYPTGTEGSMNAKTYAVVSEGERSYIYIAIDTSGTSISTFNNIYWIDHSTAQQIIGEQQNNTWLWSIIQDGDFRIREIADYKNVIGEAFYAGFGFEPGKTLLAFEVTSGVSASTIVSNIRTFDVYMKWSEPSHAGGSND